MQKDADNDGHCFFNIFKQDYVRRTWAFSVLVAACLGVVASLYITVYVALRVCDGTLRGPQVILIKMDFFH